MGTGSKCMEGGITKCNMLNWSETACNDQNGCYWGNGRCRGTPKDDDGEESSEAPAEEGCAQYTKKKDACNNAEGCYYTKKGKCEEGEAPFDCESTKDPNVC